MAKNNFKVRDLNILFVYLFYFALTGKIGEERKVNGLMDYTVCLLVLMLNVIVFVSVTTYCAMK